MIERDADYPRDLSGYGAKPPDPKWPGGARIAINFALNYEAGGELCLLHGDDRSESLMTDFGLAPVAGGRSLSSESAFEYGSRRGVWRLLRLFAERDIRISVFAVVMGLMRAPEVGRALVEAGHEMVSHGWRWIDYQHLPEDEEREHIRLAVEGIKQVCGARPIGCMTGRTSPNTRRLLVEEGGFIYDRDAFNDELPYWVVVEGKPHLAIPYSLETNDNRFDGNSGFNTADDFFQYMRDSFDVLYAEGETEPKMMSLGLHDRLIGRPGRAAGLARFLDYVLNHDRVWICTGAEIARHWIETHPYDVGVGEIG